MNPQNFASSWNSLAISSFQCLSTMDAVFRSFPPFLAPTLRILRLSLPLRTIMQMLCNFRNNLTFLKICPVDLGGNFPLIAPLWTNCKTPPAPHLALLCALATKWHTTHRKFYIWQTDKHWSVLNQCSFFFFFSFWLFSSFSTRFSFFFSKRLYQSDMKQWPKPMMNLVYCWQQQLEGV